MTEPLSRPVRAPHTNIARSLTHADLVLIARDHRGIDGWRRRRVGHIDRSSGPGAMSDKAGFRRYERPGSRRT